MVWFKRTFRTGSGSRYIRHTGKYGKSSEVLDDSPPSIASFMTPSLKEILKIFNKNIVFLIARGERNIEKKNMGIPNLGLKLHKKSNNSCEILYKNRYMDRNKHDDLSNENVKRILELLERHDIPDCAVTKIIIKFKSKELQEKLGTKDNLFFAHLVLHQCENDNERNIWEEYGINGDYPEGLLHQGFKHSVLHCIGLIDNHQLRTVPKKKRKHHIFWIERNKDLKKSDIDFHSRPEIALEVKVNLPKYGVLKKYRREKATGLVLSSIEK
jgi:hypothetical protein